MYQCLGAIQRFPTADTQHRIALGLLSDAIQPIDFIL